ncbi:hypothetical protein OSTOST_21576 [Ostertagia ostertagi]
MELHCSYPFPHDSTCKRGCTDKERDNHVNHGATAVPVDADGLIEGNYDQVVSSFDEMNLKENLLRGVYAFGYEKPSAIQQRAIVPCCTLTDAIKMFVLDEADEMLSRGFKNQIYEVFKTMPQDVQRVNFAY